MKTTCSSQSECGSFRLLVALIIAMGACFWYGGQGVYTALKNRKAVRLGMEDLAKTRPSAHWLVLTNAELAVYDAAWKTVRSKYTPESMARITEGYIPLRAPGQTLKDTCYAVLATKEPAMLSLLEELRQVKDDAAMERFVKKHKTELKQSRQISGLVRFGIEKGAESGKLAGLQANLAPGFVVVADGEKPAMGKSVGLLLVGFLIGGGMLMAWRSNREPTADEIT